MMPIESKSPTGVKARVTPSATGQDVGHWRDPEVDRGFRSALWAECPRGQEGSVRGTLRAVRTAVPITRTPTLATIPLHSHHHAREGLEAQLRQCWAMDSALPTEANRYQVVQLERLLMEI